MNPYFDRRDYDVEAKFVEGLRERRTKRNAPQKKECGTESDDGGTSSNDESCSEEKSPLSSSSSSLLFSSTSSRRTQKSIGREEGESDDDAWMAGKKNALARRWEKQRNGVNRLRPGKIRLQSSQSQDTDDEKVEFGNEDISPVRKNSRIMDSDDDNDGDDDDDNDDNDDGDDDDNSSEDERKTTGGNRKRPTDDMDQKYDKVLVETDED